VALILTLVLGTLGARVVGWIGVDYVDTWPKAIAVGLAAMFMFAGIGHFVNPSGRDMVAVVPPRPRCLSRSLRWDWRSEWSPGRSSPTGSVG
jgi:hypothetical protein